MPPITEAKLYEAFGLTPPESQGAQVQEVAEPAAEGNAVQPEDGAQAQEVAAPAQEEPNPQEETEPAEPSAEEPDPVPGEKPSLSEEQRRANAARRRQQEQQAAIDAAVRQERERNTAQVNGILQGLGLKDTFTGETIATVEQLGAWQQKMGEAKLQRDLQSGKLTVESLHQAMSQHPAIQQAQQMLEQQKQEQLAQQQAAEKLRIEGEIAEISKMDPSIKTVADLLTMPTAAQFKGYVAKGLSFLDAFKLSNMERMATAQAEAAKQEAMNNSRGKEHLKATGAGRGAGTATVSPSQMAVFRQMNPGATDAEIVQFYTNYLSRKGG